MERPSFCRASAVVIFCGRGQRVITLALIDKLHRRPDGTARRNFSDNKDRFIEEKHFYLVDFSKKNEFRAFGIDVPPCGLTILTNRGYSMLVKLFTDDFSWEVQEQLEALGLINVKIARLKKLSKGGSS